MGRSAAWWRRLLGWPEPAEEPADETLEYPWRGRWDRVPKRSAGPDFGRADYSEARRRAREVARPRDPFEALRPKRVDAHGHPIQPRILKRMCEVLEQLPIGGEREILNPLDSRNRPN